MAKNSYAKGFHDLGKGNYAYLQPDGSWGWNNAGLILDGGQALLVDTLYDEDLTGQMLTQMQHELGVGVDDVGSVVNTHANGDHTFGNHLVRNAEIIASQASADEFSDLTPKMMVELVQQSDKDTLSGRFLRHAFGPFNFAGVTLTPPTRTFNGSLEMKVGNKTIRILEVGPAHTRGDVLVHSPEDRVVYTGDILFIDSTPIIWAGPVANWIKAIDWILDADIETIVPGHGPVTDKRGARRLRDYFVYIDKETRKRFDSGMSAADAAFDIALCDFATWGDAERIVMNVHALYREYSGKPTGASIMQLVELMARIRSDQGRL